VNLLRYTAKEPLLVLMALLSKITTRDENLPHFVGDQWSSSVWTRLGRPIAEERFGRMARV
jgi:hypothetical protein